LAAAFWFLRGSRTGLGIDNLFGFSGWWKYNTTFIASVFGLAWLVTDPLVKAFYTLRVFYGGPQHGRGPAREARGVGGSRRPPDRPSRCCCSSSRAPPAPGPWRPRRPAPRPRQPRETGRLHRRVLAGRGLPVAPAPAASEADDEKDGPLKRFVRSGVEMIKAIARDIGRL